MLRPSGAWANRPPSSVSLTLATSPRRVAQGCRKEAPVLGLSEQGSHRPGQPAAQVFVCRALGSEQGGARRAPRGGLLGREQLGPLCLAPRAGISQERLRLAAAPRDRALSVGLRRGPQPVRLGTRSGEQRPAQRLEGL